MSKISALIFSAYGLVTLLQAQNTTTDVLNLGGTEVQVVRHVSAKPGYLFYNMHDNENTGVEAAQKLIRKNGGILCELVHSGGRYIEFDVGAHHYSIDPNRIYSDTGVWRELDRTAVRDTQVFDMVRNFATELIDLLQIDTHALVVTLHNNTDGNYSIRSYMPGAVYESDAATIYDSRWKDDDEFFFVTSAELYHQLRPAGFNIVLQNNSSVTDDGSLSVYCGQRDIGYVNIEAQHGKKKANKKMVKRLLGLLAD